ncbi:MAG: carboxymuconolactone decarboxylase family protein [Hyphomicrobiaceae bacterium]|nr:carboxymuconolactone decarboxylase family protein [Hyphomicrobiaceae bacterium]
MPTVKLLSDEELSPKAKAVFDDIRATRKTDFINNTWRAQANHPDLLERNWAKAKAIMGPGTLDPVTKELIYLAVSMVNNCEYCVHSHTYFARQKGMTDAQYHELLDIIGLAVENNVLMNAMQVPVDDRFTVES